MPSANQQEGNSSQSCETIPFLVDESEHEHFKPVLSLTFITFGVCFTLSANQAELMQDSLAYLPQECEACISSTASRCYFLVDCSDFSTSQKTRFQLYCNGQRLYTCADRLGLLEQFSSIIALDVAEMSPLRTFVHAGVVGWGKSAILIPGRSFSGKTALVAKLVQAGATYYSDDFAVFDRLGAVYPYARPLQVRESGSCRQIQYPVEALGGIAGTDPLQVGLVIVSRYSPGAHWRPQPLSPGMGALKILDNTISARRSPAIALSTLKQVVADALIVRGVRGEARQVVEWITARLGSPRLHARAIK